MMNRGHQVNELLRTIQAYHLDDRHPDDLDNIVFMAEQGMLNDDQARAYLIMMQDWIEEQKRRPNLLPRAPDAEELGTFDVEVADLAERQDLRAGIRFRDRPRHILAAGATGFGKSTLVRAIVYGIDQWNKRHG